MLSTPLVPSNVVTYSQEFHQRARLIFRHLFSGGSYGAVRRSIVAGVLVIERLGYGLGSFLAFLGFVVNVVCPCVALKNKWSGSGLDLKKKAKKLFCLSRAHTTFTTFTINIHKKAQRVRPGLIGSRWVYWPISFINSTTAARRSRSCSACWANRSCTPVFTR